MVCLGTFLTMMEETGCSVRRAQATFEKNVIHLTVISNCTATAIEARALQECQHLTSCSSLGAFPIPVCDNREINASSKLHSHISLDAARCVDVGEAIIAARHVRGTG
jgi:hypothetical protein